jgi:hypothetical protein
MAESRRLDQNETDPCLSRETLLVIFHWFIPYESYRFHNVKAHFFDFWEED